MSRRDLIRRAVLIMGSVPAGLSALAAVGCGDDDDEDTEEVTQALASPTAATTTATAAPSPSPEPSAVGAPRTSDLRLKGPGSDLLGYIAQPAQAGAYPGIVIIHENRGLTDHFKDLSRRYANEGFVALAVDLVSRQGGSKSAAEANTSALGSAKIEDLVADMQAYVDT